MKFKLAYLLKIIIFNLITLLVLLVCLELSGRAVAYFVLGPKINRYIIWEDDTFGWTLNVKANPERRTNRCGEEIVYAPPDSPLIVRSSTNPTGETVLFLGDSYTHAHEVSSGRAYYDFFENESAGRYSVFAVGVGGYGNLQEFMALERVFDQIRPYVVIWQLSGNDVENNVYEFEKASFGNNNQRPRPYLDLESGKVEVKNPGFFLLEYSDLFRYLFQKFLIIDHKFELGLVSKLKNSLYPKGTRRLELQKQGLEVLNRLLKKARTKFPQVRFYGFSVGGGYEDEFKKIFVQNGAGYFPDFFKTVNQVANTDCRPLDAHWNHLGNHVAGTALLRRFEQAETLRQHNLH